MKKGLLLILTLTLWCSACFADQYVLVMSKDDCVCQHMLEIYNEDLEEYGEIKYDQHEEFKAIKWEKKRRFLRMEQGRKVYSPLEIDNIVLTSQFDINNDGKVEIVIKEPIQSQTIYYLKGETSTGFKDEEFDASIYKDATGVIRRYAAGFDELTYKLRELPKISFDVPGTGKGNSHYGIGPNFYINPFLYNGSYYVDIKDEREYPAWLVVLKYTQENRPNDICYYLKICEACAAKSRTQGEE